MRVFAKVRHLGKRTDLLKPNLFLFLLTKGFDALGAGSQFCAVGHCDRLQIGLLFPLGRRVKLGGAQPHARPDHFAFFGAYFANFCHSDFC